MKRVLILGCIFFSLLLLGCRNARSNESKLVFAEEMKSLLQKESPILIDVRTPEEFAEGHIENAKNIDFHSDTFKDEILKLDRNESILLYCRSGGRSGKATKILLEEGFKKVFDLKGGITKWKEKGFKLVK